MEKINFGDLGTRKAKGISVQKASEDAKAVVNRETDIRQVAAVGFGDGLLTLSTTDAAANLATLNAALAKGDVKLKRGNYPLTPGVLVDNVTLDLNGSCLTSSVRTSTGLITMKGERPVIRDGELCGTFHVAKNEEGYTWYESESLIRMALYGDALIENVELHNCWGYAIGHGEPDWGTEAKRVNISTATDVTSDLSIGITSETKRYLSNCISIPTGYKYATLYGGIGYNRIVSRRDVIYYFYDSNGSKIATISETPRVMVAIPKNASKVKVLTYQYGDYIPANIGFFNREVRCMTVRDCCIHNNHSLGMIGMAYGMMRILNCRSYGHGKPRKDVLPQNANTNTVAFIDVEDLETPMVILEGCTSEDEPNLALLGAYKSIINHCTGNVTIYRGWYANISNCIGKVSAFGNSVATIINVSNCTITSANTTSANWNGSNNAYIDCQPDDLTKETNFIVRREHRTSGSTGVGQTPPITGLVRGKIYNVHVTSGNIGIRQVATAMGSSFTYEWNLATNTSDASHGYIAVSGDCYGITANCPFYPNGKKIHNSTFTPIHSFGAGKSPNNWWTGEYVDCTFNISTGAMFYCDKGYGVSSSDKVLVFRNCTINITAAQTGKTQYYLFRKGVANAKEKGYKVQFINCKISDESLLFHPDAKDIPYEIISEDRDATIKTLLSRIEALEGITAAQIKEL